MGWLGLALMLAGGLSVGPAVGAGCRPALVDSLSVHVAAGHPVVSVMVAGEPVSMLLDTGAEISAVTPSVAARLGLRVETGGPDRATGIGDRAGHMVAATEAVVGLTGRGVRRRLLVLDLPGAAGAVAGLAGVDLLADYDVDLDEAAGQLTLWRAGAACGVGMPAWAGLNAVRLEATFTPRGRVVLPVRFGPATVGALLDTGVDGPVVARDAAERAGMTAAAWEAGDRASLAGPGLRVATVRTVRLADAEVGQERLGALAVSVPEAGLPGAEMLLGNDWVGAHRVLISWAQRMVWVAAARARQ